MKNLRQQATLFSRVFWRALADTGKDWPACLIGGYRKGLVLPIDGHRQPFPMLTASFIDPCFARHRAGFFAAFGGRDGPNNQA